MGAIAFGATAKEAAGFEASSAEDVVVNHEDKMNARDLNLRTDAPAGI